MYAQKRTDTVATSAPEHRGKPVEEAIYGLVNAFVNALPEWQKITEVFRSEALRAKEQGRPVEAAMCSRLASRFSTLEEFLENEVEVKELILWLPIQNMHLTQSALERKVWMIQFIREQAFETETNRSLIQQATERPGRFPETRGVTVHALELHMTGQNWGEIEKSLLPHRRNTQNPGRSICREGQFLKKILKRYQVCPQNI